MDFSIARAIAAANGVQGIPTLSEYGLMLLTLLLGAVGFKSIQDKKKATTIAGALFLAVASLTGIPVTSSAGHAATITNADGCTTINLDGDNNDIRLIKACLNSNTNILTVEVTENYPNPIVVNHDPVAVDDLAVVVQ